MIIIRKNDRTADLNKELQRKEEIPVSDLQKCEGKKECSVADSVLESATGGVSADYTRPIEKNKNIEGPVHIGCASPLIFHQIEGVYYCPKCRKEVPLNEILK